MERATGLCTGRDGEVQELTQFKTAMLAFVWPSRSLASLLHQAFSSLNSIITPCTLHAPSSLRREDLWSDLGCTWVVRTTLTKHKLLPTAHSLHPVSANRCCLPSSPAAAAAAISPATTCKNTQSRAGRILSPMRHCFHESSAPPIWGEKRELYLPCSHKRVSG